MLMKLRMGNIMKYGLAPPKGCYEILQSMFVIRTIFAIVVIKLFLLYFIDNDYVGFVYV